MNELSGERVSHLVGLIYDCVLAPARWSVAVEAIRAEFSFANGTLSSVSLPAGEHLLAAAAGITPHWMARIDEFSDSLIDLWGGHDRIGQYPLEEPIVLSQACDPAATAKNAYYREWAKPQGIVDAVVIGLERGPAMLANVAFGRHGSTEPVNGFVEDGLRLLAPHLRRAVNISRVLEAKSFEASSFAAALDAHTAAVAMVDAGMHLLYANKAAEAMLSSDGPIQVRHGCLGVTDRAAERSLEAAVAHCATDEALLGQRSGTGIAFRARDDEGFIIHLLPLKQRKILPEVARRPVVALFITRSNRPLASLPSQALDVLYGLTPAETRVFELIVEGSTQADAAAHLGIAPSTLKTHLLRVFEKTGARRQSDLVRLAQSLALPL